MENLHESGKIYYFRTDISEKPSDAFGPLLEVNSNFDILKSLNISDGKALGITSNNELLEWEYDSKQKIISKSNSNNKSINSKKQDFYFLLFKPSYHFHKIKFSKIVLNKSLCLGLDVYHNVLVWGQNKEGLLGLGYEITSVEIPTIIPKLKEIKEISLSEYHAVVINNNGDAFSWGLGKYGELGLERSIYTSTPQPIITETIYSKVFCGNLVTCFIDENGKFYYYGVIIKQLGGYGNIFTLKSLLNDQSFQDGKNIYFEKEIEELENESFKNISIGNGFVALLSKNGLLYVLEYNNKLTMLYSNYFLYHITVAYNDIYGLARERPKIDKNKKDNYYLYKWSSKYSSENDLYSEIWTTTVWKFKDDFQIISNCKLLDTNYNKNILLLKDQDKEYNLTNSIFNPHRKNLEISTQNNDLPLLENSVNNLNISAFGDLVINKKILPEKFLEYKNQYDDSYNIKYKKCKLKINIKTGIDNSSLNLNNNKSRTLTPFFKINSNNGNNKNNSSMSPYIDQNLSHNNNLFSESYNAQIDLGKDNDNVNIYKLEDDGDIMDAKEKELNKYRKEVDNIINNFKIKKELNNKSINSIKKTNNENNLKYISQNNSNQNDRYSSSDANFYGINGDDQNNVERNKFKLSKGEILNLMKLEKEKKENISTYNDSLSRVRNNIISLKDKIKFKDNALKNINNLFTFSEEEDEKTDNENGDQTGDEKIKKNYSMKIKNRKKLLKFKRSPSFSKLKSRYKNKKTNIFKNIEDGNNNSDSDDFVNIEDLKGYERKRYNSKDSIYLKGNKGKDNESDNNVNNLGLRYISGNNSENENLINSQLKDKNINNKNGKNIYKNENNENQTKKKNKYKGRKKENRDNNSEINEEDDEEEEEEDDNDNDDDENKINKINKKLRKNNKENIKTIQSNEENIELIGKKKIIKNKNNNENEDINNIYQNSKNINKKRNKYEFENINGNMNNKISSKKNLNNRNKMMKNKKTNKNKLNDDIGEENDDEDIDENIEEDEEEEEGTEFFDEVIENNKKVRKIKKSRGNKRIKTKKSNSLSNEDFMKIHKPQAYKLLEDSFKEEKNKLKDNKYSRSLDKIDKRKSISNIINSGNRLYNNKRTRKRYKKNNIQEEEIEENENEDEEGIEGENIKGKNIINKKKNNKSKNRQNIKNKNNNKTEDEISNNSEIKNEYNENNEITFKKKIKNDKNKIIDNKRQFNNGKINLIKNNKNEKENSKNSYSDNISDNSINRSNKNNKINKQKNKNIHKNNNINNIYENNKNNNNNNNVNIKFLKIRSNGIAMNKFSLMYFCDLVEHYMKKKSFALCARQIANYQKYLEIKFSLKIMFRVMLKRIIFYKLKFMHRYKRINKYLIKNKIKNIKSVYQNKK